MSGEKFNFSWSEYDEQSKNLLQNIYESSFFKDVTLVSEDEMIFEAHKVMLASRSEYFRKMLLSKDHPSPMIAVSIDGSILDSILKFLYLGQVSINKTNIDCFIRGAKFLKIQGLDTNASSLEYTDLNESSSDLVNIVDEASRRLQENENSIIPPSEIQVTDDSSMGNDDHDDEVLQELLLKKQTEHIEINLVDEDETDSEQAEMMTMNNTDDIQEVEVVTESVNDATDSYADSLHEESETIYCDRCDFETVTSEDYQEHLFVEHANDIPCKSCDFTAKDKASIKEHMMTTHDGISCNNCHKKFGDLSLLRKHILANESCMANLF